MKRFATLLALLLALAPGVHAQTDTFAPDGWTRGDSVRDENWDMTATGAPNAPSEVAEYETDFTRQMPDGVEQHLVTRASQARQDLSDAYFQNLQHDALGQTPIQVGQGGFGWRERATATAATRVGNTLVLELHVDAVTDADPVSDDQVASWFAAFVGQPAPAATDWTQLLPDQPRAWQFLLDAGLVGGDWQQDTGLELRSREQSGQVQSVSAAREFSRPVPYQRTVTSTATVFGSASAAAAQGMNGDGTKIDAPSMGEASVAFRRTESGGGDAPTVTYDVRVRRGAIVMSTEETGVVWSLDAPDEAFGLAAALDAHAAQLLTQ